MTITAPEYRSLKLAHSPKTGKHSSGQITYRILADQRQSLYLMLVANEGGGWFSKEAVPFARIEEVFDAEADPASVISSKQLRAAFVSRSVNNAGFLAAVLRAEGLLAPAPDEANKHVRAGDWAAWRAAMLAMIGESYDPSESRTSSGLRESKPPLSVSQTSPKRGGRETRPNGRVSSSPSQEEASMGEQGEQGGGE